METYKNLGGQSGVAAFEVSESSIAVKFSDGAIYSYSDRSAGAANIEHMKLLALQGHGLNSFINSYVKMKYERKIR